MVSIKKPYITASQSFNLIFIIKRSNKLKKIGEVKRYISLKNCRTTQSCSLELKRSIKFERSTK